LRSKVTLGMAGILLLPFEGGFVKIRMLERTAIQP
jgi:glutamine phosphoribosylpyrophosphate amidotransferase